MFCKIFFCVFPSFLFSQIAMKCNTSVCALSWANMQLMLFSRSVMWDSLQPHGWQHARLPYPSPSPGVHANSCLFSQWCHPTILSSVIPFSSCLQSFPASGSFPLSQLFTSRGQSIRVSASASVPPTNIQDWFHLGLTGLIFLPSKGLSRVFSNTTIQKHHFSESQPSLWSNSHIHTYYWKNHSFDYLAYTKKSTQNNW